VNTLKHLSQVFKSAEQISFDDSSRFVLMSDCHRGDGSWADDFSDNQNLYIGALNYYYKENYTYIELGDGDELWKNSKISNIIIVNNDAFSLLSKFYKDKRLYFIFGNHDMVKKDSNFIKSNFNKYFDERKKKYIPLFEDITIYEGMILNYTVTTGKIFLVHGHQVDFVNDNLWKLSRFLVKHLWKPLELLGIKDPISAATNYEKKESVEKKLVEWVIREKQMLIAGHTHRSMFPDVCDPPYFNDGSCVHPRYITCIEIADGNISLVKWQIKTKNDGSLFVCREIFEEPRKLKDYFEFSRLVTNTKSD
jgi:UDP-2,3-diacylglucosamine pyrophosphatase LpxH